MKQFFFLMLALACAPFANAQTQAFTYDTEYSPAYKKLSGTRFEITGTLLGSGATNYFFAVTNQAGNKEVYDIYTDVLQDDFGKILQSSVYDFGAAALTDSQLRLEAREGAFGKTVYSVLITNVPHQIRIESLILKKTIMKEDVRAIFFFDTEAGAQNLIDFLKK